MQSSSQIITTNKPTSSFFLQAGCPSCHPTNSVKALNEEVIVSIYISTRTHPNTHTHEHTHTHTHTPTSTLTHSTVYPAQRLTWHNTTYLHAGFVDIHIIATAAVNGLTEDDYFLVQKDAANTLLAAVVDCEVSLMQQHALLLQIHLQDHVHHCTELCYLIQIL